MAKKVGVKKDIMNNSITKQEEANVEKLLASIDTKSIATRKRNKPFKSKEERQHVVSVLRNVLEEFIGPYVIVGFDLNDAPFMDVNAQSGLEQKAVMGLFEEIADQILDPHPMMFGQMPPGDDY